MRTPIHITGVRQACLLLLVSVSLLTKAQSNGFGAGIILGEPTGISLKGWIAEDRAIDGALAWSLRSGSYFSIHADYLFHNMTLILINKGRLPLYYGPGARLRSWTGHRHWHNGRWHAHDGSRASLGIRFPVGLNYLPENAPVDIFLEVVPALDLLPSTTFDIGAAIGARYWF